MLELEGMHFECVIYFLSFFQLQSMLHELIFLESYLRIFFIGILINKVTLNSLVLGPL